MAAASGPSWSPSAGPEGGWIGALSAAPDGTLYAGAGSADGAGHGGVYRSTDGGATWTQRATGLPTTQAVTAIGRAADGTLVAGVQYDGVYRSTDGGGSWSPASGQPSSTVVNAFALAADGALVAGTGGGDHPSVFRSLDSGAHWSVCGTGLPSYISVNDIVRGPDGRLLAGAGDFMSGKAFLSADDGAHWSTIATGLAGATPQAVAIAPSGALWAGANGQVFACTDTTIGWTQVQDLGYDVEGLAARGDGTLFAATYFGGVFRSTDGGTTWQQSNAGLLTYDIRRIALAADGDVIVGSPSGIHVSEDSAASWQWRNAGLDWLQARCVAIAPGGSLFAGTDDAGVFRSTDGGASWTSLPAFPGRPIVECLAFTSDGTLVAGTNSGSGNRPGGIFKSVDGGTSWSSINTGLPYPMVYTVTVEPTGTLYCHPWGYGVYRSNDGGATWQATPYSTGFIEALAVSSDGTVVAGTPTGVVRGTNHATTWGGTIPLGSRVVALAVPSSGTTWYAGTYSTGVFRSVNGGTSWTSASSGLGAGEVYGLGVGPDGTVYAGTMSGVFRSTDSGASWTSYNAGLGNTRVRDLAVGLGGIILAGTDRGAWVEHHDGRAPQTTADVVPASPDGLSDWYVTAPSVGLSADETATTQYQWDGTGGSWSTYATTLTAGEGAHTLYYRSIDSAGNTETARSLALSVDTALPSDPGLASTSHSVGTTSTDHEVDVSVSGATDTASGVAGFSVLWSSDPTETPDAIVDHPADTADISSGELADGTWYVHVRTRDVAGHWTSTAHEGPFALARGVTALTAGTSATKTRYGGKVTVTGMLSSSLEGGPSVPVTGSSAVTLMRSTNGGVTWLPVAQATDASGTGTYSAPANVDRNTRFRFSYTGDTGHLGCVSPAVNVSCGAYLSTPSTPPSVLKGRTFTISGYLKPRHPGKTKVEVWRKIGTRWVRYRVPLALNADYSTYTRYSLRYAVPYSGWWRVRAYHADAGHLATYSGWRAFSAR